MKDTVYPHFKKWCINNGVKTIPSSDRFFKVLKDEGIEPIQKAEFNKKRVYEGYTLKTLQNVTGSQAQSTTSVNFSLLNYIEKEEERNKNREKEIESGCDPVTSSEPTTCYYCREPITSKGFTILEGHVCCYGCFDKLNEERKEASQ